MLSVVDLRVDLLLVVCRPETKFNISPCYLKNGTCTSISQYCSACTVILIEPAVNASLRARVEYLNR